MIVAVVIPCFAVRRHIMPLLARIGPEVQHIYCVDDACPEQSGQLIEEQCRDPRVVVLRNPQNTGVGGAVMAGYLRAIADGATVLVKLDGDGQMDPSLVEQFVAPIRDGRADYTKGNRFYDLEKVTAMPTVRIIGNAGLTFLAKFSSGYWDLFDPTNGYTAIRASVAAQLPMHKISQRYFFESDLLFRLNLLRARVRDVPMTAVYADETSHLKLSRAFFEFAFKHLRNTFKRIFYSYFLRDFSIASVQLVTGFGLAAFGALFGVYHWIDSVSRGVTTPTGTVMLAALPVMLGVQLLLAFLSYDYASTPR